MTSLRRSTRVRSIHQLPALKNTGHDNRDETTQDFADKKTIQKDNIRGSKHSTEDDKSGANKLPQHIATNSPPSTPLTKRKRIDGSPVKGVPVTPTPFMAGLMSAPAKDNVSGNLTTPAPRRGRKVVTDKANAPLRTPKGSKITVEASDTEKTSPTSVFGAVSQTTTENLLEQACAHLIEIDPKLKTLIEKHQCRIFSPEGLAEEIDPFRSLTSGIMAQQVSVAAASSIQKKFVALFNDGVEDSAHVFPTPEQVAGTDLTRLRTAGLSGRKAEYIKGLAEKFASGELTTKMLVEATDEEVLEKLTAIRGLGRWSVEMFACFGLKRTDILSTGDLGVQ